MLRLLIIVSFLVLLTAPVSAQNLLAGDPLIEAAKGGNIEGVRSAIIKGVSVNRRDRSKRTAMMYAALQGANDIIDLLVAENALPDLQDKEGDTALHLASNKGYADIVTALLASGANGNVENKAGETALMRAASLGHLAVVRSLIAAKVDLSLTDYTGRSALDLALDQRRKDVAQALKRAGAP